MYKHIKFIWWLIKNKRKLSEFMNVDILSPNLLIQGFDWMISSQKSYNSLNPEQKRLSDELSLKLKEFDSITKDAKMKIWQDETSEIKVKIKME